MLAAAVLSFDGIQFKCTQWLKHGTPGASISLLKSDLQSGRSQYYDIFVASSRENLKVIILSPLPNEVQAVFISLYMCVGLPYPSWFNT